MHADNIIVLTDEPITNIPLSNTVVFVFEVLYRLKLDVIDEQIDKVTHKLRIK